ncbi:MAG TPA: type ISP restriction/modification enzyme [Gemmataceae bacterium]|jgi:hypothetical protein
MRWVYWEPTTKLLDEKRPEYYRNLFPQNLMLFTTGRTRKDLIEPAIMTKRLTDLNSMDSGARGIPLYVVHDSQVEMGEIRNEPHRINWSTEAEGYAKSLNSKEDDLFLHCLVILHSPTYRQENTHAIKSDWPRIPLPATRDLLLASAALGRQVAALLDTETAVNGVTAGKPRPELKIVGVPARVGGGSLNPSSELDVTARWGIAGKGGVCMPGKGKAVGRAYTPDERSALAAGAAALGLDANAFLACLGATTFDVYLNDVAFWRCVPARVWAYTLGGYQVMKKWLSYRERGLLGRALTLGELTEVMHMARRIAALLLLQPVLDANYQAVKAATYVWPKTTDI